MKKSFVVFVAAISCCGSLLSQTFTANITGVISDPAGAAVPEAQAVLKNPNNGETRKTVTDDLGRYTFSQVLPAGYTMTISKPGFREYVQTGIQLTNNQSVELNLQLQIGATSERVEVNAAASLLDTQTANKSTTLSETMVANLPLSNRAALTLVTATAGGVYMSSFMGANANDDQNVARFNMFGGRQNSTPILIDGVPATAGDWGGLIAQPGADSVQELQVIRNNYEAQYGRSGAGVVNMTTKGGSNQYHGTLFEYFRNDKLNANDFFSNLNGRAKIKSTRNQYGGNFGGPIWARKRLSGFVGIERSSYGVPGSRTSTLPSLLERAGDFSKTFNANGSLQTIYDPTTTRSDPARPGFFLRTAFPGNIVPAARFDRIASNYLKIIPLPNTAGTAPTNANNYFNSGAGRNTNQRYDFNFDWAPSDNDAVWARITKGKSTDYGVAFFDPAVEPSIPQVHPRFHVSIGNSYTLNPTTIINVTVGGGRWYEHWPNYSLGFDMTTLGFSPELARVLGVPTAPTVSFGGSYSSLGSNRELRLSRQTYNGQVNVTKERGSHSIKFGYSLESNQLNSFDQNGASFAFDNVPTVGPDPDSRSTLAGNGVASMLLGAGTSGAVPLRLTPAITDRSHAFYLQDSWKATRRLTVIYGARYEIQKARTERYNRLDYFDADIANPFGAKVGLPNMKGGILFADAKNRTAWDTPYNNVAPRLGLAYKITDKFVVRAGYGVSYLKTVVLQPTNSVDGYSFTTPWTTTLDGGRTVANYWSNAFPQGIISPSGSSLGLATQLGQNVAEFARVRPTPYVQAYSLDVQYEFSKNSLLEVGYAGRAGRKLLTPGAFELNQLPDSLLSLGNSLLDSVPNPFFGLIATGTLSGPTVQRGQLLRRYPQFTSAGVLGTPGTSSSFNSLDAKWTQRFKKGMTLQASYQFSKAIDNASEDDASVGATGRFRNYNNISLERSISAHDIPHSLVITSVYELPVGKGKSFGANMPRVLNVAIGGWSLSGIYSYTSGLPMTISTSNNTFSFGGNQYPNVSDRSQLALANPTRLAWFNTAVFSQPANFTFGNAPRYIADVRQDATNNLDLGIGKTFSLPDRIRIQFRGEFFNAFNHNQFSGPGTTFATSTFGQITSSRSVPRQIQLALRLTF